MNIEIEGQINWFNPENGEYSAGPTELISLAVDDAQAGATGGIFAIKTPKWVNCDELKEAIYATFGQATPQQHLDDWASDRFVPYGQKKKKSDVEYGTEIWPFPIVADGNPMEEGDDGLKSSFGYWNFNGQTKDSIEFAPA